MRKPHVDPTAIARSQQIEKQLAEVEMELGGYHLQHPLTEIIKPTAQPRHSRNHQQLYTENC